MVGSLDSLEYFSIEMPMEKNAIPLDCRQTISLSDIWIPSQLLLNRNKRCNTGGTRDIYHTLQKKDSTKYSESFSVYVEQETKNEQEDIYLSDSDEDICNSVSMNLKETTRISDNLSVNLKHDPTHFPNYKDKKYFENETDNALFRRNEDSVCSNLNTSSVNNLCSYDEQKNANMLYVEKDSEKSYRSMDKDDNIFIQNVEKIGFSGSLSRSASKSILLEQIKDFNNKQTLKKVIKDSDSNVSLSEIVNDAPLISLKDFDCNFEIRRKENNSNDYSYCDRQKVSKKAKKEKKVKKQEKSLPFESLFEDMNATQEFNCNRYMNNILREKERCARVGDNPLVSKEEYPDLTSEDLPFYHSDNMGKEENVEFTPTFSFMHSDKASIEKIVPDDVVLNDLNKFEVPTNQNVNVEEASSKLFKSSKLVIENIPHDVSKEDISSILCGYGEIKNFSMISTGKCLKAFVEIDCEEDCDIGWIIECLNGSEPFGTSTGVLKCYQQTE